MERGAGGGMKRLRRSDQSVSGRGRDGARGRGREGREGGREVEAIGAGREMGGQRMRELKGERGERR